MLSNIPEMQDIIFYMIPINFRSAGLSDSIFLTIEEI